jgi:hypothetical protein
MDQNKTNDPEKRNWREKLGIGTNGASKELPKISDDFKKTAPAGAAIVTAPRPMAPRADASAKPAVRTAPMAPRPGSAPIAKASIARPAAPVSPDKLAERLRSQRDASTKLAEQRVQVARQRAETIAPAARPIPASPIPALPINAGPKPKFTFAEEEANAVRQAPAGPQAKPAAAVQRSASQQAVPPRQTPFQPQSNQQQPALAPSRPSLGAAQQPFPPRPQQPPPGYPPQGYGQQPPGYRPIDPATGYPQQPYQPYGQPPYQPQGQQPGQQQGRPPFVPNQRFSNPPPQNYVPPGGAGPRLNVPQRTGLNPSMNANFQGQEPTAFNTPQAGMRQPSRVSRETDVYDDMAADDGMFDEPAPSLQRPAGRRPTSVDYQQAYRDAEAGFEDEMPRSKLPWILPGILLLGVLLAGLLVWGYQTTWKPMMNGTQQTATTKTEVPVVPAPAQPPKAQPDQTQQTNAAGGATRKQIYDRIVGDKEVPGGQLVPTEEAPMQQDGTNTVPQPADAIGNGTGDAASPAQGGDAVPLPIPPPPGDNTQGALPTQPEDPNKQSAENITPAADESQAAVAIPAPGEQTAVAQDAVPETAAPVPGEQQTTSSEEQVLTDEPKVVVPKKKLAAAAGKVKQPPKKQTANLGVKPVVLVPATRKARAATQTVDVAQADTGTEAEGLYGTKYIVDTPAATANNADAGVVAAPKKKRTLADLFQGSGTDASAQTASSSVPEATLPKAAAPVVASKPAAPVQQASAASSGYVAQLASFRSNAEATAEFARLRSKYGSALGGLSPVIRQGEVAGTTRYRLAVGPFASRDAANALCSKLFAAGERDCLVRN